MSDTLTLVERDVVYRRDGDRAWLAHVYAPAGVEEYPRPLLVDVHGGAWSGGTRFAGERVDRALVEALGIVVVAIDFRLAPDDPYPAMMQDLNYAVRWVKAHAAGLGGRPDGVGAIGWSSGGHMAILGAVRPYHPPYQVLPLAGATAGIQDATLAYVVACWPPVDPLARYRFAEQTGRADLVEKSEGCFLTEDAMREASAERVVAAGEAQTLPPTLIVQGTADANIPLPMIERFAAACRAAGGPLQLEIFEGQRHGFISRPGPDADRALSVITDFVARHAPARP